MSDDPDNKNLTERVAVLERELARVKAQLEEWMGLPLMDEEMSAEADIERESLPPPLPVVTDGVPDELAHPAVDDRFSRSSREEQRREEERPPPRDLRVALRKWKLWPPEGEGNLEVQAGAWWATRIGALLAVIGVVFFGIYVVHGTPPWVRLLELVLVAIGVTAGGEWLERREGRFGSVVFGSGLALLFFSGFAAYAVPAVRVIDQPVVAAALQGALVIGIAGISIWKNRSNLATMAILFGFVTCLFSFFAQLQDMSLVAAFLLAATGTALWLTKGWLLPFACSVPAAYGIYGIIVWRGWMTSPPGNWMLALLFPVAAFVLFATTDLAGLRRRPELSRRNRRLLQSCNAAAAVGFGLLATKRYFGDSLATFYVLFSALFLVFAFFYYRRDREDEYGALWFAVGMGLLALALVEVLDARTRWIALGVQSMVALYAARRTELRTGEAVMGVIWIGSAGLFIWDTGNAGYFWGEGHAWSLWGATAAGYLVLSGVLLSLQGRWFANRPILLSGGQKGREGESLAKDRVQVNLFYALCLGAVACAAVIAGFSVVHLPSGALLAGVLLLGCALGARHWVALLAAGGVFVFGQFSFWGLGYEIDSGWTVWLNGGVAIVSAVAVAAAVVIGQHREKISAEWAKYSPVVHVFWLVSLEVLLFKVASLEANLFVMACAGLLLLGVAGWRRLDRLADLFVVPVAASWAGLYVARSKGMPNLPSSESSILLWAALGVMLLSVCLYDRWERLEGLARAVSSKLFVRILGFGTVTVSTLFLLGREFELPAVIAATGIGGLLILLLTRWPGWRDGVYSGVAVSLAGHSQFLVSLGMKTGNEVLSVLILAGATLTAAVQVGGKQIVRREGLAGALQWLLGFSVLGTLFLLFLTRTGSLEPYTTAFWGVSAIVVFATGLVWRVKQLRVVGLVGLVACLPRVFLVDIHSAFYRIAAFVVVGVVLLIVGFLYHRFRDYISEGNEGKKEQEE